MRAKEGVTSHGSRGGIGKRNLMDNTYLRFGRRGGERVERGRG